MNRFTSNTLTAFALLASVAGLAATAPATPIFSQTPPSNIDARATDRDFGADGFQFADDLTLASADTARSVTWRGVFSSANTPLAPVSFDLIFYGNTAGNLPDETNVLSSTTVSFASVADFTNTGINANGFAVYEFRADLTPTALPATQVWFSVLADTGNDADDNFFWTTGSSGDAAAFRENLSGNGAFTSAGVDGPFYFVLDNAVVPEPASLALLALGGLALLRRRAVGATALAAIALSATAEPARADIDWRVSFASESGIVTTSGDPAAFVAADYDILAVLFQTSDGQTIDTSVTAPSFITWDGSSVTGINGDPDFAYFIADAPPSGFTRGMDIRADGKTSEYFFVLVGGDISAGPTTWAPQIVPEPASLALLGLAGLALLTSRASVRGRRRR